MLNPASWVDGIDPFLSTVGLGSKMGLVDKIDDALLPPKSLRVGNHYWRINSTLEAGYILVVSDRLPICHITGGGNADLQPVVQAVIASPEFASHWEAIEDVSRDDMASTRFRNRKEQSFSILISRANLPGQRTDRVQLLATATYEVEK